MEKKNKYSAEQILHSIDGIERAEPNYFLFIRIQEKVKGGYETIPRWMRRALVPVYASLAIFIVMNVASYLHFHAATIQPKQEQSKSPVQHFADEYGLQQSVY